MNFNPNIKYAHSRGVDLPLMYVYLAGYMSGEKLKECTEWRKQIREYYRNWETSPKSIDEIGSYKQMQYESLAFPIAFLDPFNGKEFKTIDKKGLKSHIPPHAIFHGDRLSVNKADIIVANLDDFFLDGIQNFIPLSNDTNKTLKQKLCMLIDKVENYRPSIGTYFELCWAYDRDKPVVLIVPENRREIYQDHPFTEQASWIVGSIDELLEKKVLETFYRRMAGAIYE